VTESEQGNNIELIIEVPNARSRGKRGYGKKPRSESRKEKSWYALVIALLRTQNPAKRRIQRPNICHLSVGMQAVNFPNKAK
jgi:hypothetical protein